MALKFYSNNANPLLLSNTKVHPSPLLNNCHIYLEPESVSIVGAWCIVDNCSGTTKKWSLVQGLRICGGVPAARNDRDDFPVWWLTHLTLVTEPLGRPGPHSLHFLVHVASQTSHLVSQRQCWPVHLGLECISLCTLYCIRFIYIHLEFIETLE